MKNLKCTSLNKITGAVARVYHTGKMEYLVEVENVEHATNRTFENLGTASAYAMRVTR
jgi:hypothetical protein